MLKPTRKDLIRVVYPNKGNQNYFYLVDFSEKDNDWIGAYRIHFHANCQYSDEKLFIPAKYFDVKGSTKTYSLHGGWVNVFTGKLSINTEYIVEVISTLDDADYNKIASAIFAVTLGNYTVDINNVYHPGEINFNTNITVKLSDVIANLNSHPIISEYIKSVPVEEGSSTSIKKNYYEDNNLYKPAHNEQKHATIAEVKKPDYPIIPKKITSTLPSDESKKVGTNIVPTQTKPTDDLFEGPCKHIWPGTNKSALVRDRFNPGKFFCQCCRKHSISMAVGSTESMPVEKKEEVIEKPVKKLDEKILRSIKRYKDCADNDSRVKTLFELFAVDGKLCISDAYISIFSMSEPRYNPRSVVVDESQFLILATETKLSLAKVLCSDIRKLNGDIAEVTTSLLRRAYSLYTGVELTAAERDRIKISDDIIADIHKLYKEGMNYISIAKELGISHKTVSNHLKDYIPNKEWSANTSSVEFLTHLHEYAHSDTLNNFADEIKIIEEIAAIMAKDLGITGLIISDKYDHANSAFKNYDLDMVKLVAIRIKHDHSFCFIIPTIIPNLIVKKGIDFVKILFNTKSKGMIDNNISFVYSLAVVVNSNINYDKPFDDIIEDPKYKIVLRMLNYWKKAYINKARISVIAKNEIYLHNTIGFPLEWFRQYNELF